MFNNVREIMYLLVLGDQDVGKTLMVSRMIGDLPILHLLEDNHSTPMKYPVIPEMGRPLELELVLQECSTSGELSKIIAENNRFPSNVVLMFHCGSDTSFANCEVFYKMIKEHRIRCEFLWISNTDYSFGGTSRWKERITQLVDEPEPRLLQTSLMEPHPDLRNVIHSFFADISKNNQFATDNLFIDNHNSSHSDITTFEVSKQRFEGPWINGSAITESRTHWETLRDGLDMEPQVRSWVGGRDDVKEKSQELAAVKRSASWSGWLFSAVQDKGDVAESHIALQGLNSGKSDDEVREILAQGNCIPSMTREKSTNKENSSVSNETSGWDTDDEVETWVEWRASWSTSVQWLRRFCFGCVDRR